MKTKSFFIWLILIIAALLTIVSFFLPFAAAKEERRERLEKYSDEMYMEEIGMTNGEAKDISLVEFYKAYSYIAGNMDGNSKEVAVVCIVILAVLAFFILLTILFALLRKSVPVMIFSVLAFGALYLLGWDFKERGVIETSQYGFGIAYYFLMALLFILFVGAIVVLVIRRKEHRLNGKV